MFYVKFLILLIVGLTATGQIEMHGTDRANESLEESANKSRRKAILQAFEAEAQVSESLKKASGDRAEVAKICPPPSGWQPSKKKVVKAEQWDIVPSGHKSKTYPRSSGIVANDAKTEFESIGDPKIENCDYVSIMFKGDQVETVDFSKCADPEFTMDSYKPCHDLLKQLAEKSK